MSWNPKKNVSAQQHTAGTGQTIKLNLEHRELENILTQLNSLSETSKTLQKDAKKFTECVHEVSKSELKLTQDLSLSPMCHYDDGMRILMEEYHSVTNESQKFCDELILVLQKALVESMKRYNSMFVGVQLALRKKEQALQDYQKLVARVEKLQHKDKTGPVVAKLELGKRDLAVAGEELSSQNRILLQELPQIFDSRVDYFQPCLESVIRAQVDYSGKFSTLLHTLVKSPLVERSQPDQFYEQNFRRRLAEIKELSIVADD